MTKVIDWRRVKRADRLLDEAERLDPTIKSRPVPVREIMQATTEGVASMKLTYSLEEAAGVTGYSSMTLRRAIRAGRLKAAGGGKGDPYRISGVELERWWRERGGGDLFPADREEED